MSIALLGPPPVRVVAGPGPRAAAEGGEDRDDGHQEDEEEMKVERGSEAAKGAGRPILSVKPQNLKKTE